MRVSGHSVESRLNIISTELSGRLAFASGAKENTSKNTRKSVLIVLIYLNSFSSELHSNTNLDFMVESSRIDTGYTTLGQKVSQPQIDSCFLSCDAVWYSRLLLTFWRGMSNYVQYKTQSGRPLTKPSLSRVHQPKFMGRSQPHKNCVRTPMPRLQLGRAFSCHFAVRYAE
jgi:hypothetical protein